jgi:hypothetical protein
MLPFFEWCESTWMGETIRNSLWLFPVIESFHLLALAVIGGAILLVDLRLLGVAFRQRRVAELASEAQPWLVRGLVVMIATGLLLFTSEAIKCYYNAAFWTKMTALLPAIIFAFSVRRKVAAAAEDRLRPIWRRLTAVVSLSLWTLVGAAGRWIGFSG